MATPVVVSQGAVSGNIGSCQVNTTDVQVDWNTVRTIAVNSCSGEVVGDYSHLDMGVLIGGGLIGSIVLLFALIAAVVID